MKKNFEKRILDREADDSDFETGAPDAEAEGQNSVGVIESAIHSFLHSLQISSPNLEIIKPVFVSPFAETLNFDPAIEENVKTHSEAVSPDPEVVNLEQEAYFDLLINQRPVLVNFDRDVVNLNSAVDNLDHVVVEDDLQDNGFVPQVVNPIPQVVNPIPQDVYHHPQDVYHHPQDVYPDAQDVYPDAQNVYPDAQNVYPDAQNVYPDAQNVYPDAQNVYPDAQNVYPDAQNVYPDAQNVYPDAQNVYPDAQNVYPDAQNVYPDALVVNPDALVVNPDALVVNPDEQVVNPDAQVVLLEPEIDCFNPAKYLNDLPEVYAHDLNINSIGLPELVFSDSDNVVSDLFNFKFSVIYPDQNIANPNADDSETIELGLDSDKADQSSGSETVDLSSITETADPSSSTETADPSSSTETADPSSSTETGMPSTGLETGESSSGSDSETEQPAAEMGEPAAETILSKLRSGRVWNRND